MTKAVTKKVMPKVSYSTTLDSSKVMIQFDNDEPKALMDMIDGKSKVIFELSNTEFSSIEFSDNKTNKKFKIFLNKKK
jgi:hypothetical protein